MILLLAVIAGLAAGLARAKIGGHQYYPPDLRQSWLLWIAVIPQLLAFHLPATSEFIPDKTAAGILVSSQILLLIFVWVNLSLPGFWVLGLGLGLNFLVIILNGGLMPISPETVGRIVPNASIDPSLFGTRLGSSKDVLLSIADTKLWLLSDRFLLPERIPYRVAFSLGDVLIAAGVFWLLWAYGNIQLVPE